MTDPALTGRDPEQAPRGLVLVLPGGADQNTRPYRSDGLQARRARLLAQQIEGPLLERGIGVWLAGYRVVGWNAGHPDHPVPSPLPDVRRRSRGSRAAAPGGARGDRGPLDGRPDRGRDGGRAQRDRGRRTGPVASRGRAGGAARRTRLRRRARALGPDHQRATGPASSPSAPVAVALSAEFVDMGPVGHYLLRRIAAWNSFAVDHARRMLG